MELSSSASEAEIKAALKKARDLRANVQGLIFLGVLFGGGYYFWYTHGGPEASTKTPGYVESQQTAAHTGSYDKSLKDTEWYVKADAPLADSKDDLDRIYRYMLDGDKEAMGKMLESGNVDLATPGERVFDAGGAKFFGAVKVRHQGSTKEFWTMRDNLTKRKP